MIKALGVAGVPVSPDGLRIFSCGNLRDLKYLPPRSCSTRERETVERVVDSETGPGVARPSSGPDKIVSSYCNRCDKAAETQPLHLAKSKPHRLPVASCDVK